MTPLEELKARILLAVRERNEIYQEVDGFHVWSPSMIHGGFLQAHELRIIADELDRLNKPWSEQIEKYFEENKNKNETDIDF